MPRDRMIQILTLAHLALGGVASVVAQIEISTESAFKNMLFVPFFALALCQSFLLSLWGAASQATLWKRLAGLVTGALYLERSPRETSDGGCPASGRSRLPRPWGRCSCCGGLGSSSNDRATSVGLHSPSPGDRGPRYGAR